MELPAMVLVNREEMERWLLQRCEGRTGIAITGAAPLSQGQAMMVYVTDQVAAGSTLIRSGQRWISMEPLPNVAATQETVDPVILPG